MAKVLVIMEIPDNQLASLEREAQERFSKWTDDALDSKKAVPQIYWPSALELFAIRILLFELKKSAKEKL
jgi:hypothetical protein